MLPCCMPPLLTLPQEYTTQPELFDDSTACGLRNLGNTCYLNSLLFSLSKLAPMRLWLEQHEKTHSMYSCVLCSLAVDVRRLTTTMQNNHFRPLTVERRGDWNIDFANRRQHDAHDALVTLLDRCNDVDFFQLRDMVPDVGHSALRYTTPFWNIFGGLQRQTTTCKTCGQRIVDHTMFSDMQLEINAPGAHTVNTCGQRIVDQTKFADMQSEINVPRAHTVELCIANHLGDEPLNDLCQSCSLFGFTPMAGSRTKHTEILRWPHVLVLHLKRWSWNAEQQRMEDR